MLSIVMRNSVSFAGYQSQGAVLCHNIFSLVLKYPRCNVECPNARSASLAMIPLLEVTPRSLLSRKLLRISLLRQSLWFDIQTQGRLQARSPLSARILSYLNTAPSRTCAPMALYSCEQGDIALPGITYQSSGLQYS